MTEEELNEWAEDFENFHARFAHIFGRKEPRQQAQKYMRGLLAPVERKNSWQLAEAVGDRLPDPTQRLLYQSHWEADKARDELEQYVIEVFGEEDGIGVVDETGFMKKGQHSVGVKRQYSGTAGKIENSQVGTFLSYATSRGQVLLDRRLYLPEEWCADPERRARAKVPAEVVFQTKPEQAREMLEHAWAQGVPMRWVTGDEVYGDAPELRAAISASGRWYVLGVRQHTPVWLERPAVDEPGPGEQSRPRTKARLAVDAPAAIPVVAVVAAWSEPRWQCLTVTEGSKGPRTYDWAYQRVIESRDSLPGAELWLLARRSLTDPTDIAYFLSNAPLELGLERLAQVAAARATIEQCLETAKGETGLDEYEVRYWHSWHRHITLAMMAQTWLAAVRSRTTAKKGGLNPSWPS
ncbi:MAG: IS701 family transposase [Candidatus Acidiferrales bacterium]